VQVYLTWNDGHKTCHPKEMVYKRCPQRVSCTQPVEIADSLEPVSGCGNGDDVLIVMIDAEVLRISSVVLP